MALLLFIEQPPKGLIFRVCKYLFMDFARVCRHHTQLGKGLFIRFHVIPDPADRCILVK